ncbi:hypothetical protein A3B21_03765 [Candidatus Uhrbacteria bacterium RIFCSPLOWO2_01_FULL_47_24]|uniref:Uncharacterized protein n=1 Tax=Candidatus Uhrbacteria bacterium RIFCSPLOWO2_01_FULL_47_24 TaxID=1802401 RepID=A0A1F7URF6_9BACT|nr:MAG: hypothetical protein A2753_01490 [Candidatus Uhrbacteria bacterium RIFCSPHIGHO2_01_FULL_47_11]OGL68548.1 MAG: hypothetical protein A3D58_02365 [Candidatus Uhrbacteria bacterium RIFCSPHIGHO2_02_FULL_46_47]OGL75485.1 MAG: hypothetical protein A3F52_04240 [Candidatus Uhrbacteria bacterium RIFCSPHIGHO2_12_FULL_47_11]OGL80856.1 MAG: hypothetical protein A3B21_03765 [Candidatus Uhrbacteria bacterium RIFCSPLOWO2_01_FULL_47_24]OGL84754.1 MAG: hypothetical protein A3J03_01120 [Candidatus Uhrbact
MVIKIEKSLLYTVLGVITAGAVLFVVARKDTVTALTPSSSRSGGSQNHSVTANSPTKENSEGDVTVSVTPQNIGPSAPIWKFEIAINTHTVDMSAFNPQTQIVLEDAAGKDTVPNNIVPEGSGHHQTLKVSFAKVEGPWKLIVRDIAGIPAREFSW